MLDPKIQEELKQKLLDDKKRLEGALGNSEKREEDVDREYQTNFSEIERDEEQNADEIEIYESTLATDETLKQELEKTNEALARIDQGTYGFCVNCQKEIPLERLRAYPQADTCLDCEA
ncbi:MAG: TraR/DksA C4-type zinc finger protein [Parcubacteria group bacterium]|jgi:RNA polymerase-binding transcription factor DksA